MAVMEDISVSVVRDELRSDMGGCPIHSQRVTRRGRRPRGCQCAESALEVLSIVAYEQPVTRADISHIRATDSSGVIETLLARGLVVNDPRFGGRGRPSFLVTTAAFLGLLGLGSLAELPPLPVQSNVA